MWQTRLRLGLCCLNTELRARGVFCSRTCTRRLFTVERAKQLALQNLADLRRMIEWNHDHGIYCFRISSDLFPHITDMQLGATDVPSVPSVPPFTIDFARPLLAEIGQLARSYGIRLLMHPGQFNQVGARDSAVYAQTVRDLQHHADILDALGTPPGEGVLIIHGGGVYGNQAATMTRWVQQFGQLPGSVQRRLVLENCEKSYSIDDCLRLSEMVYQAQGWRLPCVLDFHHYVCWNLLKRRQVVDVNSVAPLLPRIMGTWPEGIAPIMHISDQDPFRPVGSHHDFVHALPECLIQGVQEHGWRVDLEIEAKAKEQAVIHLYRQYNYPGYPKLVIRLKTRT